MNGPIIASQAIARAFDVMKSVGWPACSPMQAMESLRLPNGHRQTMLAWDILVARAVALRQGYMAMNPVDQLHHQPGQTWSGISEYMLDCIDLAENHPLNGWSQ
jgi:hypothetical protein